MDDPPVAATLLIVPASEPIQGWLIDAAGHEHSFHGWLELAAAIELLRCSTPRLPNDFTPVPARS
jgi:hypothetical protein